MNSQTDATEKKGSDEATTKSASSKSRRVRVRRSRNDEPKKAPSKAAKKATTKGQAGTSSKARMMAEDTPEPSKTPATEKPVKLTPPERTSQYVVTVDNTTGIPTKIEKLDSSTGERKELSQAEYLQLGAAYTNPVAAMSGVPGYLGAPSASEGLNSAYYKGVLDYLNALGLYQ